MHYCFDCSFSVTFVLFHCSTEVHSEHHSGQGYVWQVVGGPDSQCQPHLLHFHYCYLRLFFLLNFLFHCFIVLQRYILNTTVGSGTFGKWWVDQIPSASRIPISFPLQWNLWITALRNEDILWNKDTSSGPKLLFRVHIALWNEDTCE
jgi:hypothetical protein